LMENTWKYTKHTTGWWFQIFFLFHFIYGMSSFPLTFIFFRGVGQPPTSQTHMVWNGEITWNHCVVKPGELL
jgi:hypothetical protein